PFAGSGEDIFTVVTDDQSYKWKVLISVLFGLFMVILDSTVVNVALNALQTKYAVGTSEAQWVISLYALALGIATPLSAFMGERFGVKRLFLGGISGFVIGSLLCGLSIGFSNNIIFLIFTRCIQGFGGGLALPLGTALLFGAFPPEERGLAFG